MIGQFITPLLEWLGIGLVPFLLGLIIIILVLKG